MGGRAENSRNRRTHLAWCKVMLSIEKPPGQVESFCFRVVQLCLGRAAPVHLAVQLDI